MNDRSHILVVDDEEALCNGLGTYLRLEGYQVSTASSAEEALTLNLDSVDLILLDIMMEGMSGIDMARVLKSNPETSSIPIIFLTAKGDDDDMVRGLNIGADDYIAKPYSARNVVARIEAVLRRTRQKCCRSNVECDRNSISCTVDGQKIKMTRKEFEILALLLDNPGKVFSRDEILSKVWPDNIVVTDRSVDVHIARIRTKISPYGKNIVSRSGYGYAWLD